MSRPFVWRSLQAGLLGSIIIEISLDPNDGSSLIARAGGEVAERADKVGELTGRRSLGGHIANKVRVLFLDLILDRFL